MSDLVSFTPVRAGGAYDARVPGALAWFYNSGTLTPRPVFADASLTTPHPVPLVANEDGIFPPVFINGGGAVKAIVRDPVTNLMLPGFPMDPAFVVPAAGGGAASVGFAPTPQIAAANVQDAIELVQENISAGLTGAGFGVTASAPLLASFDATDTASGRYRISDATPGDRPAAAAGQPGVVDMLRQTSGAGVMVLYLTEADRVFLRRLNGTWQAWNEMTHDGRAVNAAAWQAGTETQLGPASPALVRAAINAFSQADVTASRGQNADYVNSTGKVLIVTVAVQSSSNAASARLQVSGVSVGRFFNGQDGVAMIGTMTAFVPPGQSYRLDTTGVITLSSWFEGQL